MCHFLLIWLKNLESLESYAPSPDPTIFVKIIHQGPGNSDFNKFSVPLSCAGDHNVVTTAVSICWQYVEFLLIIILSSMWPWTRTRKSYLQNQSQTCRKGNVVLFEGCGLLALFHDVPLYNSGVAMPWTPLSNLTTAPHFSTAITSPFTRSPSTRLAKGLPCSFMCATIVS